MCYITVIFLLVYLNMNHFLIYLLHNRIFGMSEIMHNCFRFLTLQSALPRMKTSSRKNIIKPFSEASLCTDALIS